MSENIKDIYPLSPMQQGMLFHSIYAPETNLYTEQLACKFVGDLKIDIFQTAWQKVVQRHDILRSAFVWEDLEEPLQAVYDEVDLPFDILDWSAKGPEEQKKAFEQLVAKEHKEGLELSEAPLMRFTLIRLAENEHYFIWNHHHLLFDGWGFAIILREIFALYEKLAQGQDAQLPAVRQFRDYIAWVQAQDRQKAEDFWRKKMAGFLAPTPLVVDSKKEQPGVAYAKERFVFSESVSEKTQQFAKNNQVTLNTIFQGAWALLLAKYNAEDDVVFGSTVSGRPTDLAGVENIVGLFINTLPLRVTIDEDLSYKEWLQQLQLQNAELRQFEYTPLVDIHKWSDVPGSLPLFNSLVIFENYPVSETLSETNSSLKITDVKSHERTNYPITLVSSPGRNITIDIAYEPERFVPEIIRRIAKHLEIIYQAMTFNPDEKTGNLQLISEEEKNLVLKEWNGPDVPFAEQSTVHGLFEEMVNKYPQATAVRFEDREVSYKELNERANQLAHYLIQQGIGPETIVTLSFPRTIELVLATVAVLKAGAAYLPIDPEYPQERIDYMIADSGTQTMIIHDSLKAQFAHHSLQTILLGKENDWLKDFSKENPRAGALPANLGFMIYTSGSTGRPKGVLLPHKGMVNLFQAMAKDLPVDKNKTMLQMASFSFDAASCEIFTGLTTGATLQMIDKDILLSTDKFVKFLNEKKITTVTIPVSLLTILPEKEIHSFETIMSVGDICTQDLALRWKDRCRFMNGYGPTEGSVGAIWSVFEEYHAFSHSAPIGRPFDNIKIYILDKQLNPAPVGIPGEIHIGGAGVSRGYFNRPGLTAEKFIPDPFSAKSGARMYRTGDLARFLPDGQVEFLGRVDFQVKIRGYRIELGEIEARISETEAVKDVVVVALGQKAEEKILAAYMIAHEGKEIDIEQIKSELGDKLPDYMVPAAFVIMEEFPLTPNGKINRKALPAPDVSDLTTAKYVAPRTPEEELLTSIWADVLKLDKVGVTSSFFELGGHSLLATQVISRIQEAFDVDIELRALFEKPTIEEIARIIEEIKKDEKGMARPPIEKVSREQKLPLSFAQQRLWFLDQLEPDNPAYNIPSAYILEGDLNEAALAKSILEIVRRHESLRTTFGDDGGKPLQIINSTFDFKIDKQDISGLAEPERQEQLKRLATEEALRPFNLASGPLFRVSLIKVSDNQHAVLFNMHHIISDGWSIGVLISEVVQLYSAFLQNEPSPLPELEIQYADFAHWQQNWLKDEVLQEQVDYWKNKLAGAPPLLEIPTDRPRPAVQTVNGASENIAFSPELSEKLKVLTRQEGVTLFMTLLAAYQTLLHRYSGQDDILVGSPIANRTNSKIEKLIGFFVNNLIMKADFSDNPEFTDLLAQVRENALEAYAHQDLPFEKLVEEIQPRRDPSHAPIFQVAFVLQNIPADRSMQLPGLTLKPVQSDAETAKYDLTLTMAEAGERLLGTMEYNSDLFDQSTIQRMLRHLEIILEAVSEDPEIQIGDINLLSKDEQQQILHEWNETDAPFHDDKCVHEVFEQLAAEQPGAPALIFKANASAEAEQLSYAQMNSKANQLARYLKNLGTNTENIVGICMERSLDMAVSMMAILKSGAAYVPIDPSYPDERIQYMIEDSGLKILLSHSKLQNKLSNFPAQTIYLDKEWENITKEGESNLALPMQPENLAYVIYTSGSTGKPKGTLLQHRGACNLAGIQRKAFKVGQGSRILQFASLSFDAATWEFLMAMLSGSAFVLTSVETITSGQELVNLISDQKVTTITLPPSVLAVWPKTELPELNTIITAGEAVSGELVEEWSKGRRFFNAYGPTETTVCASMHECRGSYPAGPPIGKANANFKLYILDQYMEAAPIGVPGELCVSGVGLARGYHNRPDLTAEKFIPNPFSETEGDRLYRTGDLVRWLADGNVEYLGRIDQQVKVRGFRIELGEIEAVLSKHENISDQIVLAREDKPGDKRLVAYVVPENSAELDTAEIKTFVRNELPDYMTPSAVVVLDKLPLTPNGKIDRKALPAPEFSREELSAEFVAPRNPIEQKLTAIVGELLNVEKVGVLDNFFELGGHSLLATQFMSRIRESFEVELALMTLFEKPTIDQLAIAVQEAQAKGTAPAKPQIKRVDRGARRVRRSELNKRSGPEPDNGKPGKER